MTPNDTTIIYSLSIMPGMLQSEVLRNTENLDDQSMKDVCLAITGFKSVEELSDQEKNDYYFLTNWAKNKRERLKTEEKKNVKIALRLNSLYKNGAINESTLFLFGISGKLPNLEDYHSWDNNRKVNYWRERIENKLGPRSDIISKFSILPSNTNWEKEGF